MSHHDTLNVIYWAAGTLSAALFGLWIALNVAHQRKRRASDPGWEQVKSAFPDCTGEMPPEHDPCIVTDPAAPGACSTPECRRTAGHIGWCAPGAVTGPKNPQREEGPR